MSGPTTLLPFQPATMTTTQLAAVSYLARYSGRTHALYGYQLGGSGSPGAKPTDRTPSQGSSEPMSSCTSASSGTGV